MTASENRLAVVEAWTAESLEAAIRQRGGAVTLGGAIRAATMAQFCGVNVF